MRTLEEAQKYHYYFKLKCQHCGTELVVRDDDLIYHPYNPVEIEVKYWDCKDPLDEAHAKIEKQLKSSDYKKDTHSFICCECGKENIINSSDRNNNSCDYTGSKSREFKLTEEQTEKLKEWEDEQYKLMEGMKIDAMYMIETFTIIPGSIGDIVKVKNNYTKNEIDLTDTDNW